jgi:hypothetical protein
VRYLLEKLISIHLVKHSLIYSMRNLHTMLKESPLNLSWNSSKQSPSAHPIIMLWVLISSHLHLVLPHGPFPWSCLIKVTYMFANTSYAVNSSWWHCYDERKLRTSKLKLNSVAWVRKRTERLSDRRLSAKLMPTLADRGCRVVSATIPPQSLISVF